MKPAAFDLPFLSAAGIRGGSQVLVWRDGLLHSVEEGSASADGTTSVTRFTSPALAGACIQVEDKWRTLEAGVVELERTVRVVGDGPAGAGFATAIRLGFDEPLRWPDVDVFAPGMLYGRQGAIGGLAIGSMRHYEAGVRAWHIRADRLPAPMVGIRLDDGRSLALLDAEPDGSTILADAHEVEPGEPIVDDGLRVASLGAEQVDHDGGPRLSLGYWFPGSEGEITYRGDCYPGGQLRAWRRRFHPLLDGATQCYRLLFRVGRHACFSAFMRESWRWAWSVLKPRLVPHDLDVARACLTRVLADNVRTVGGKTGPSIWVPADTGAGGDEAQYMGFCGRSTDAAYHLLREAARIAADRDNADPATAQRYRRLATRTLDDFCTLAMDPPQAEGFRDGRPHTFPFMGVHDVLYLRSLCEGARAALRAWQFERAVGRDHPAWRAWAETFAGWLVRQQRADGSFPRAVRPGTGEVVNPSPHSSYVAVPFLVLMHQVTGEGRWLDAAVRAADFCWADGQDRGAFIGGTIDNPDMVDKEAGTLSLEAYLRLHEVAPHGRWLERACAAADFAATWIYLWDVHLPRDADESTLHWKRSASTIGSQLISTGHSLVDQYMAFDAGNYARLSNCTGDVRYREIAAILLHNTKSMLALPGRTWDLAGPGWQQEHWSHAPRRGIGLHRGWLPWLAVSHLEGMAGVEEAGGCGR